MVASFGVADRQPDDIVLLSAFYQQKKEANDA